MDTGVYGAVLSILFFILALTGEAPARVKREP